MIIRKIALAAEGTYQTATVKTSPISTGPVGELRRQVRCAQHRTSVWWRLSRFHGGTAFTGSSAP